MPSGLQRWEARHDAATGMTFYIDHLQKKTYWEDDVPAEAAAALLQASSPRLRAANAMHPSASAPDLRGESAQSRCAGSQALNPQPILDSLCPTPSGVLATDHETAHGWCRSFHRRAEPHAPSSTLSGTKLWSERGLKAPQASQMSRRVG